MALIHNLIIGFLFVRSMATFLLTQLFEGLNQEHIFAVRMTDVQMSRRELAIVIVVATAIFSFLSQVQDHHPLAAVSLAYFYTTLLIDIYLKIFSKPSPEFITR